MYVFFMGREKEKILENSQEGLSQIRRQPQDAIKTPPLKQLQINHRTRVLLKGLCPHPTQT